MAPSSWRTAGAVLLATALLGGCADRSGTPPGADVQAKSELTRSLMDAATAALAQGDAVTAAGYFRGVYTRDPQNIAAAIGLMQSLRLMGGLDEARNVSTKVLAAKPDDPVVLAEVGKVRLAQGQAQDAIMLLERAAAADAQDWRTRSAIGLAYDRLGDFDRADASYAAALEISPENAAVLNNFALSRVMAGDLEGARKLAQRAAATAGADLRVRQNLALIYALSGNLGKAEELTRRDLPPAIARATIDYYRDIAAVAAAPRPLP